MPGSSSRVSSGTFESLKNAIDVLRRENIISDREGVTLEARVFKTRRIGSRSLRHPSPVTAVLTSPTTRSESSIGSPAPTSTAMAAIRAELAPSPSSRTGYSPEDDEAILRFVGERPDAKLGGNAVWKEAEEHQVTTHPWQSMRDRFLKKLRQRYTKRVSGVSLPGPSSSSKKQAGGHMTPMQSNMRTRTTSRVFATPIQSEASAAEGHKRRKRVRVT